MNLREGDEVSAVALVVEDDAPTAASAAEHPVSLDASGTGDEDALSAGLAEDADVPESEAVISADPTDDSTLTPPEVTEEDLEI